MDELGQEELSEAQRALLLEKRSDLNWVLGDRASAEKGYEEELRLGLSDSRRRAVSIKRNSSSDEILRYLVEQVQGGAAWVVLFELQQKDPALAAYLMGIRLFYEGHYELAQRYLSTRQSAAELEEERFILYLKSCRLSEDWEAWTVALSNPPDLRQRASALFREEQERGRWTQKP